MIISKGNTQDFPKLRGDISGLRYPVYVEPKIDGELDWYVPCCEDEAGYLINKSGKIRSDCPIVKELDAMLPIDQWPCPTNGLLGELHWGDGKKGQLYEFLSHQKDDDLRFTVFDVDMPGTYEERIAWLVKHIPSWTSTGHVRLITNNRADNKAEVMELYKCWTQDSEEGGYEGIVVKSADSRLIMGPCSWVKMKEFQSCECTITSIDPSRERIEVDPCQYMNNPIGRKPVRVGVKVPTVEKIKLRVGDIIEIEHLGILDSGALRNPVYKPRETYVKSKGAVRT